MLERRPLIIVGAGPAGAATALFLHARHPERARDMLILEKAHHPRPKVCAGGLIPHTLDCLRELDVPLSVPHVAVTRAAVDVPGRQVTYADGELCRVVRRNEFDHSLVLACRSRGIEVREDVKVTDLYPGDDGVYVETEGRRYHAPVIVGADGSGSIVRRSLVRQGRDCVGRAVMTDVPLSQSNWAGFDTRQYEFRFTDVPRGLRGYAWRFPCLIDGARHVNVGIYSVNASGSGLQLNRLLGEELTQLRAPALPVKAFPIRWYGHGVRIAAPHVLLVGDAAGVDPLMGEGISFAFEYGRYAAEAIAQALRASAFDFAAYEAAVAQSWMGKKLRRLELATRLFYGPTWRVWFSIAAHSRTAQEIGIRWYNGIDGWDRRSGWAAVHAWWRGDVSTHADGAGH